MEQELIYNPKIAIIGAGPAGCMCAIQLGKGHDVTLFDVSKPLKTLLPTGGGRCNFAHAEFDFKELAACYPRGQKFLYSVFSKFSTQDTLGFFEKIGVKYYTQDDGRIFPISNSAAEVREKMLNQLKWAKFRRERVVNLKKYGEKFIVETEQGESEFDFVVVAIGTHLGLQFLNNLPHNILKLKPSLCGLITKEDFSTLKGVTLKGVSLNYKKVILKDDIIFTENGISGPLIFKISALNSREIFPYSIRLNFLISGVNFCKLIELGKNKDLKTVLFSILPKSFVIFILNKLQISTKIKCNTIRSNTKELLLEGLSNFEVEIIGTRKGGETVFSGGIDLCEIRSDLESKLIDKLYFCGEILDIDGYCGGYNLQNCWSTATLAAKSILKVMSDMCLNHKE